MQTVSFYSYKGGVGRSLLVANTARFLSLSGLRVVALDLDFEAPGLHYKLRDDEALATAAAGDLRGAVDYLVDALEQDEPPPSLEAHAVTIRTPPDLPGSIRLIPAGSAPHEHYWAQLARLGEVRREHEAEGSLTMALLDLAARIEDELHADYLLIDARTGVTELGGLATTALADRVVCLSLPTDECLDGTLTVVKALSSSQRPLDRPKAVVEVLLSRAGKGSRGRLTTKGWSAEAANAVHVLHHDDSSLEAEQHLGSEHVAQRRSGLLAETVDWLERTFPNAGKGSVSAARRMRAVDSVVEALTHTKPQPTPSHESGSRWSVTQIRNGVTFASGKTKRFADLALYVDAKAPADVKPDMVVEYVGNAAPKLIASWWISRVEVRAVCLIIDPGDANRDFELELFTDRCRDGVRTYRGKLPSSNDFRSLDDVADQSPEARLAAVGKGHRGYTYELVRDWARSTEATVHGGMPWRPDRARAIEEAFVAGGGHLFVLGGAWLCDEHRGIGSSGRAMADRVSRDLLAPVWWRTDLEEAHSFDRERRHDDGQRLAVHAFVATRLMGLRYDPDDQLRHDAGALFRDRKNGKRDGYLDHQRFKRLEMSYDLEASFPVTEIREVALRLGLSDSSEKAPLPEPDTLIHALHARSLLATVGVLGTYDPETTTLRFYRALIAAAANILGVAVSSLERVVHMHLAVLAYTHLGRDADGRMWETFALPRRIGTAVQPGTELTTIAQYFVFRLIERLDDARLREAFERLSDVQPLPYGQWRALTHIPIEDVRAWLMTMRRGTGADGAARLALLLSERSRSE